MLLSNKDFNAKLDIKTISIISGGFLSTIEDIFQSDIVELLFESCHVPLQRIVQDTVYILIDINGLNFVKIRNLHWY